MCEIENKAAVFVRVEYEGGSCFYCGRPSNLYRYGFTGNKLSEPVCGLDCYANLTAGREAAHEKSQR